MIMKKNTFLLLVVFILVAFTSIVSAETFYVAGTNDADFKWTAPESGLYRFTIVSGAFSPYPTDDPAEYPEYPPYWANNIHILNNTPVRWVHLTDPDRWGADFDYYLGDGVKYPSSIAAETAGIGKKVTIPMDANKYVTLICPDTQGQYSDNRGGMTVSVTRTTTDLIVTGIEPIQTFVNTDINSDGMADIISGKTMAVKINLIGSNFEGLDDTQEIHTKIIYEGVDVGSFTATVGDVKSTESMTFKFTPTGNSVKNIQVVVDWDNIIAETNENNNQLTQPLPINVFDKKGMKVLFVPIDGTTTSYGNVDISNCDYNKNLAKGFIRKTYPVNPDKIDFRSATPIKGSLDKTVIQRSNGKILSQGMTDDCKALLSMGSSNGVDFVVGQVPPGYFTYHTKIEESGFTGTITISGKGKKAVQVKCILQRSDQWKSISHELGHAYGTTDEYNIKKNYFGNIVSGYDVDTMKPVNNALCFMGTPAPGTTQNDYTWWVCKDTYRTLFNNF